MDQLIKELAAFKAELKRNATDDDHDIEIGNIAAAEKAAKDGDKSKALEFLSKAGKWTIEILTKIGTSLGAALLKELIIPR